MKYTRTRLASAICISNGRHVVVVEVATAVAQWEQWRKNRVRHVCNNNSNSSSSNNNGIAFHVYAEFISLVSLFFRVAAAAVVVVCLVPYVRRKVYGLPNVFAIVNVMHT